MTIVAVLSMWMIAKCTWKKNDNVPDDYKLNLSGYGAKGSIE